MYDKVFLMFCIDFLISGKNREYKSISSSSHWYVKDTVKSHSPFNSSGLPTQTIVTYVFIQYDYLHHKLCRRSEKEPLLKIHINSERV